jgi:hypothetical protein
MRCAEKRSSNLTRTLLRSRRCLAKPKAGIVGSACVHPNRNFLNVFRLFLPVQIFFEKFSAFLLRQIDGEYWSIRNPDERSDMREALVPDVAEPVIGRAFARPVGSLYRGDEESAYSPFSFDMRSRRSCMSLIWRRSSSMLPSLAAGSGAFSDSAPAVPLRGGANGLNIEKVC